MGNRTLTAAEGYCARKLGSKLTRALLDLAEARIAAAALGQDVLRDLGVGTIFPLLSDVEPRLAAFRDAIRASVPAALGAVKWEAAADEKRLGDPGAVLGKLDTPDA